jgi:hypothetical protein
VSTLHRRRPPRKRPQAKNPNGPPDGASWIWWTQEMYESFAGRELFKHDAALSLVHRIALEHLRHAGKENGRLKITYDDFQEWGISRARIGDAIAIAEALGFIKRVKRGRASWEDQRKSGEFALRWISLERHEKTAIFRNSALIWVMQSRRYFHGLCRPVSTRCGRAVRPGPSPPKS